MFYGRSFIYDGVPSENYNIYIMSIDGNAVNQSMASSSMEIREQKIYRKATPYFYGMTPSPNLSFEFESYSEDELDASAFELISKWLFSSRTYKGFQIDQPDIQDVIFYAVMLEPKIVRVGNLIRGFSATVQCNSPFAFRFPKTTSYTFTQTIVDETETYLNLSDDDGDYLYPTNMVVQMNNISGGFTITNLDDNDRVVEFEDLSGDETLTISPLYQTISSSTGLRRLSNSNKKFLRLVPGVNRLRVQGNIASLSFTNQWIVKKIGG